MFIIGITGGTGAGKTSAVRSLQKLGALALDCDKIYHELLLSSEDMKEEIGTHFKGVLTDNKIDRQKLSAIVFENPGSLKDLNAITHKYVGAEIKRRIDEFKAQGGKAAAIDAIALIESGQNKSCDVVIGVTAPEDKRTLRIMDRDNITREQALMRINAQQAESFYRENCDHVLVNEYDTQSEFEEKCLDFFRRLLSDEQSRGTS